MLYKILYILLLALNQTKLKKHVYKLTQIWRIKAKRSERYRFSLRLCVYPLTSPHAAKVSKEKWFNETTQYLFASSPNEMTDTTGLGYPMTPLCMCANNFCRWCARKGYRQIRFLFGAGLFWFEAYYRKTKNYGKKIIFEILFTEVWMKNVVKKCLKWCCSIKAIYLVLQCLLFIKQDSNR